MIARTFIKIGLNISFAVTGLHSSMIEDMELFFPRDNDPGESTILIDVNGALLIPDYFYFWNLETNFPTNIWGDCSWIAVTMYLSYLETCNKNGLIDSNYVVHSYDSVSSVAAFGESPGTVDGEPYNNSDGITNSFYKWFAPYYVNRGFNWPVLRYNSLYLTHFSDQAALLRAPFGSLSYTESVDYFINEYSLFMAGPGMFNYIVNELQTGRPVIANTTAHSFIIYGYIPNTHQFVVHNGWKNGHSHDIFDNDNPGGESSSVQYVISSNFYAHAHSYFYHNGNAVYCACGDDAWSVPYLHKHQWSIHYVKPKVRYYQCTVCGERN